jgi:hypothetical protein
MANHRVTVTVRSRIGDEGPLTVADAMRQVLDFFLLLEAAQTDEQGGKQVSWQLVHVSMESPFEASAEPFAVEAGVPADLIGRRAGYRVAISLEEITARGTVPDWMDESARERLRRIFKRNLNGVGRTDFRIGSEIPVVAIVEKTARAGLRALERDALEDEAKREDLSRSEYGSIEGDVAETTTYYHRPALTVRDRLTGQDVMCILTPELAGAIGAEHNWQEVWDARRVIVSGEVFYSAKGLPERVNVVDFRVVEPKEIAASAIFDSGFTAGMTSAEYIDKLREGDLG